MIIITINPFHTMSQYADVTQVNITTADALATSSTDTALCLTLYIWP